MPSPLPTAEPSCPAPPVPLVSLQPYLQEARERCARSLQEVERRFPKGIPQLDPEDDMKIQVRACACMHILSPRHLRLRHGLDRAVSHCDQNPASWVLFQGRALAG